MLQAEVSGGVISTTTDGILKYSIDGGAETTINNNTAISSGNFTKTLKFVFYVNDQIVDVETVPMLVDGKDGADGESITAAGHWESANIPYAKNSTVSFAGELIGTATANKNGLMSKIFVVTDIERGKGLIIDYKADSNGLYTSSSLIEIYVYSGANTAFYRVMSIPTGSKNIEIKYMGAHWCDFKYANSKLYVLPKSDDSSISYKVSLVRRTKPNFLTIDFSDFSNITGEIITPTPD